MRLCVPHPEGSQRAVGVGITGAGSLALGCRAGKQGLALPPRRVLAGLREVACRGDQGG